MTLKKLLGSAPSTYDLIPGITCCCIISGTETSSELPTSNPKNSGGVTPTMAKGAAPVGNVLSKNGRSARNGPAQRVWGKDQTGQLAGGAASAGDIRPPKARVYPQHSVIIPAPDLARHSRFRLTIHTHAQPQ